MPELNRTQFEEHIHPHQQALPGMEHLSHPWAGPLSKGYMLSYSHSRHEHHLTAVDVSDPDQHEEAAELSWTKQRTKVPGEVALVTNFHRDPYSPEEHRSPRAKGLAGALFHSAHRWNFGQDTVPIHSETRSESGEHFASTVRPDLKPDVWANYQSGRTTRAPGKPRDEEPKWPGIKGPIHPFEHEEAERRTQEIVKGLKARTDLNPAQGTLFHDRRG